MRPILIKLRSIVTNPVNHTNPHNMPRDNTQQKNTITPRGEHADDAVCVPHVAEPRACAGEKRKEATDDEPNKSEPSQKHPDRATDKTPDFPLPSYTIVANERKEQTERAPQPHLPIM
jgi:hypothetical protein